MDDRKLLWAGIGGPVLFTLVFLVDGAMTPGYSPMRNWISSLALSDHGWIQTASFLAVGSLCTAFAVGLHQTFTAGPGAVWGPRLVACTGLALIAAGVFVIDPGLGYPPGPALKGSSWHGLLHQLAGLLVFVTLAGTAFVYGRRFARGYALTAGIAVIALWLAASTLAGLDYGGVWSPAPAGLLERLSIGAGFAWTVFLARWAQTMRPKIKNTAGPPR